MLIAALLPLVLCAFCGVRANAADSGAGVPAIGDIAYADAQQRAASEKKYLLVLFSGEWVPEEAQVKNTVLQDKRVVRAMADRVIVTRADAVRDTKQMRQFHIRVLPTLVLLNPDGADVGRWTGAKASDLADDLSKVLKSGRTLYEINTPKTSDDKEHWRYASQLARSGAYEPALKEYLRYYDGKDNWYSSRLITTENNLITTLLGMSKVYPEARNAIDVRLEKFKSKIAASPDDIAAAGHAIEIANALGGDDGVNAVIDIYQQTKPGKARAMLKWKAFAAFVQKKEYDKAVTVISPDEALGVVNDIIDGNDTINGKSNDTLGLLHEATDPGSNFTFVGPGARERDESHFSYLNRRALSLIFGAYAGAGDEQVARKVAQTLMSEKSVHKIIIASDISADKKPAQKTTAAQKNTETIVALLGSALIDCRPNDAKDFAAKIGLPAEATDASRQRVIQTQQTGNAAN